MSTLLLIVAGFVIGAGWVLWIWRDHSRAVRLRAELAELDAKRPHRTRCYLIAWIEDDRVVRVSTHGAPPWSLTRTGREECSVLIYEGVGDSYADARAELRAAYPLLTPALAARFPFPGGES